VITILIEDINDFTMLYSSVNFATGLIVTGYFIYPDLSAGNVFTFTELGDGVYGIRLIPTNLNSLVLKESDLMQKYGLVLKENGIVKRFSIVSFSVKGSEI